MPRQSIRRIDFALVYGHIRSWPEEDWKQLCELREQYQRENGRKVKAKRAAKGPEGAA